MAVTPQDLPLFDVTTPPIKTPKRPKAQSSDRPRWSRYRPVNPVKCDDCMLLLAITKGEAPASRQARYRRNLGDSDLLLCFAHAQERREEDGLKPYREPRR